MTIVDTKKRDAVLGVLEDVVLTGGAFAGTFYSTHDLTEATTAALATQGGKGALALALSRGWSSRLTKAVSVISLGIKFAEQYDPQHQLVPASVEKQGTSLAAQVDNALAGK